MYKGYNESFISIWTKAGEEGFWRGEALNEAPGSVEIRRFYWQIGWLETYRLYMTPMFDHVDMRANMEVAYDNSEQFM